VSWVKKVGGKKGVKKLQFFDMQAAANFCQRRLWVFRMTTLPLNSPNGSSQPIILYLKKKIFSKKKIFGKKG